MMIYLLKSIACLLILLLLHRLLLQREAMHRFNRFYLLFSVVAAFLIPLFTIEVQAVVEEPTKVLSQDYLPESINQANMDLTPVYTAVEETHFNWEYLLIGIYSLISLIFLFRFVRNIKVLINQIQRNVKISYRGQTLVLLKEDAIPYSFLNYIFVAKADLDDGKFTDAVFEHELTHVKEKHSWDILFIEALMVPFWFHPGLYWAKATIKLNHEFIADEVALRSTPLEKYESQLLAMMLSGQKYGLASSLNFSLTKKRFEMMKRKSMNSKSWIKIVFLVPVIGVLVYFFSERVTAKAEPNSTMSELYVNASKSDLSEVDFDLTLQLKPNGAISFENKEYDPDQAKVFIRGRKANAENFKINLITSSTTKMGDLGDFQKMLGVLGIRRIYYKYPNSSGRNELANRSDITESYYLIYGDPLTRSQSGQPVSKEKYYQQASIFVEDESGNLNPKSYNELTDTEKSFLLEPLTSPARNQPSDGLFESWKVQKNFALWLDGKVISNSLLEQMGSAEIVFYLSSPVMAKARTERFPQAYQVHLYSDTGFEKEFGKGSGFGESLTKEDKRYIYPSANRVNVGKPWIRKSNEPISQFINSNSSYGSYVEEMNDYKSELDAGVHFIKKNEVDQNKLMTQFLDLSATYFRLSDNEKRQGGKPKHPFAPYIRFENEGKVMYKVWEDMTEYERKQVPSPPPLENNSEELVAYNRNLNAYELNRNSGEHFIKKSSWKQEMAMDNYRLVQNQYSVLPLAEKKLTAMPTHPYSPYVRIEKEGLISFKLVKDLTEEEKKAMNC